MAIWARASAASSCLTCTHHRHVPLSGIAARQGRFDIVNSPLTEEAVLGFEYGYSVQTKTTMTVWEAQYGDFVNGAQVFIDQYIAAGEFKWGYESALAVLLPHGHEGVGPEHSSGYLGRFLQLCADENMRIVVPSTSAQWFHLLRQQATTKRRTPLIVMSPKSKLYGNVASHSTLREMIDGAFQCVLGDERIADASAVERVVLCSGKFYYELRDARDGSGDESTAIIRIEQLYPFRMTHSGACSPGSPACAASFGRRRKTAIRAHGDSFATNWRPCFPPIAPYAMSAAPRHQPARILPSRRIVGNKHGWSRPPWRRPSFRPSANFAAGRWASIARNVRSYAGYPSSQSPD